jgi:hypothetical protein
MYTGVRNPSPNPHLTMYTWVRNPGPNPHLTMYTGVRNPSPNPHLTMYTGVPIWVYMLLLLPSQFLANPKSHLRQRISVLQTQQGPSTAAEKIKQYQDTCPNFGGPATSAHTKYYTAGNVKGPSNPQQTALCSQLNARRRASVQHDVVKLQVPVGHVVRVQVAHRRQELLRRWRVEGHARRALAGRRQQPGQRKLKAAPSSDNRQAHATLSGTNRP